MSYWNDRAKKYDDSLVDHKWAGMLADSLENNHAELYAELVESEQLRGYLIVKVARAIEEFKSLKSDGYPDNEAIEITFESLFPGADEDSGPTEDWEYEDGLEEQAQWFATQVGSTKKMSQWDESQHPRDEDGKFTSGTGAAPKTPERFRVMETFDDKKRRWVAKNRDTPAGKLIGELDNMGRSIAAEMNRKGYTIDQWKRAEGTGQAGWDLTTVRNLIENLITDDPLQEDIDAAEDFVFDDFYALGYPENYSPAMGDWDSTTEPERMPPEQVFPSGPKNMMDIDAKRRGDYMPESEAARQIDEWKAYAKILGQTQDNSNKVIISLFDDSGHWSQPYVDAGYTVVRHDINSGDDLLMDAWIDERIAEARQSGAEIYGVLSACPCKTFTSSGSQWWAGRHDVEDPEQLEKAFGTPALMSGAKSASEYNVMLYEATKRIIEQAAPTGFHVLENPARTRIHKLTDIGEARATFEPWNFGEPATKRTGLWGDFNSEMPTANVVPPTGNKGSKSWMLGGKDPLSKEKRSETPEGFAYAFFMANHESEDNDGQKLFKFGLQPGATKQFGGKTYTLNENHRWTLPKDDNKTQSVKSDPTDSETGPRAAPDINDVPGQLVELAASEGDSPEQIKARQAVASNFLKKNGVYRDWQTGDMKPLTPEKIRGMMEGIDWTQPVHAGPPPEIPPPDKFGQYQAPGASRGSYFGPPGQTPDQSGIGEFATAWNVDGRPIVKRQEKLFQFRDDFALPYLFSTAGAIVDNWGAENMTQAAGGGGMQWFIPLAASDDFKSIDRTKRMAMEMPGTFADVMQMGQKLYDVTPDPYLGSILRQLEAIGRWSKLPPDPELLDELTMMRTIVREFTPVPHPDLGPFIDGAEAIYSAFREYAESGQSNE